MIYRCITFLFLLLVHLVPQIILYGKLVISSKRIHKPKITIKLFFKQIHFLGSYKDVLIMHVYLGLEIKNYESGHEA